MDCTVEYIEINECCPGYGGQDCGRKYNILIVKIGER